MDQKRPYNDIPNDDTAPVPPVSGGTMPVPSVSGDTMPLPSPEEAASPEAEKAAPQGEAPAAAGGKSAPEDGKKPGGKKAKKKAPREKRSPILSRRARTALAVGCSCCCSADCCSRAFSPTM